MVRHEGWCWARNEFCWWHWSAGMLYMVITCCNICQAANQLQWQFLIEPHREYVLTDVKPTTLNPVSKSLFSMCWYVVCEHYHDILLMLAEGCESSTWLRWCTCAWHLRVLIEQTAYAVIIFPDWLKQKCSVWCYWDMFSYIRDNAGQRCK